MQPLAQEAECTVRVDQRLNHRRAATLITQTVREDGSLHLVIGAGNRYLVADIPEPIVSEMLDHAAHIQDEDRRTAYIEDWLTDNITRIREAHEQALEGEAAVREFSFSIVPVRRVRGVPAHSLSGIPRLIQDRETIQALQARLGVLSRDGALHLDTRAELASLDREIGRILREHTNAEGVISQDGIRLLNGSVVRGEVHQPGILGRVHALIDGPDSPVERDRAVHRRAVGAMARLYEVGSDASLALAREIMSNLEDYAYGSQTSTGAPDRVDLEPLFERADEIAPREEESAPRQAPAPTERRPARGRLSAAPRPVPRPVVRPSPPATTVEEPTDTATVTARPPPRPVVRERSAPPPAPAVRVTPTHARAVTIPDGLHARDRPDEITLTRQEVPLLIALARERLALLEGFLSRVSGGEHADERDYLRTQLRTIRMHAGTRGAGGSLRSAIESPSMRRLATAVREADVLINTIETGLARVVTRREEAAAQARAATEEARARAQAAAQARAAEEAAIRRRAGAPADWVIPRGYEAHPWQVSRAYIDRIRERDGERANFAGSIERAPALLSMAGEFTGATGSYPRAYDLTLAVGRESVRLRVVLTAEDIRAACAAARPRVAYNTSTADEDLRVLRVPASRRRIEAALVARYQQIARAYFTHRGLTPPRGLNGRVATAVGGLIDRVTAAQEMEAVRVTGPEATSLRPTIASGAGTEANPFIVRIPVPASGRAGTELFRSRDIHPVVQAGSADRGRSVFFRLSFVRASVEGEVPRVGRRDLISTVSGMISRRTERHLRLRTGQVPIPTRPITQAIGDATAATRPAPIREYIR